jgi:FixJ family two-component response regulator
MALFDAGSVIEWPRGRDRNWCRVYGGFDRIVGDRMPKPTLVAVVEDDRYFREAMRSLMRSRGYCVEAFRSPADLLASPHLSETACFIADVQMPAMTGPELYRRLIASGYQIPTILVTAYADDRVRSRALNDGVVYCLWKPVDESDLLR